MADWYRRETWSKEDEIEFFDKLKRAQKHNKSQYLRIQALSLYNTNDRKLLRIAEFLACKVITDYPDAMIDMASTHQLLGNIYEELGETDNAIMHYRKALETEKNHPSVSTDAYLDYAEYIIRIWRTDLFEEVEKILFEKVSKAYFPIQKYKLCIILAIISRHKKDEVNAKKYIELARENAGAQTSGLRYHKNLGLVKETDRWLEKILK